MLLNSNILRYDDFPDNIWERISKVDDLRVISCQETPRSYTSASQALKITGSEHNGGQNMAKLSEFHGMPEIPGDSVDEVFLNIWVHDKLLYTILDIKVPKFGGM